MAGTGMKIIGERPKAPACFCASCGKRIPVRFDTNTDWHLRTRTYNGQFWYGGYGRFMALAGHREPVNVRFCNYRVCMRQFALRAYGAGYRVKP
jgi:hypothetical protein